MKKWIAVPCLIWALGAGTAMAADVPAVPPSAAEAVEQDKEDARAIGPLDLNMADWYEQAGYLLTEDRLPDNTTFHSLMGTKSSGGLLAINKDGKTVTACVSILSPASDRTRMFMQGFFMPGDQMSIASSLEVMAFNRRLYRMEADANMMFLNTIKKFRTPETPIPYDLVTLSVNRIHPAAAMSLSPRIYDSDFRSIFVVDGFMIPVYSRLYLFKQGGEARLMILGSWDSDHELVKDTGDKIVKKLAQ
jgi:hypothetical protein